jgi:hypothetical protein
VVPGAGRVRHHALFGLVRISLPVQTSIAVAEARTIAVAVQRHFRGSGHLKRYSRRVHQHLPLYTHIDRGEMPPASGGPPSGGCPRGGVHSYGGGGAGLLAYYLPTPWPPLTQRARLGPGPLSVCYQRVAAWPLTCVFTHSSGLDIRCSSGLEGGGSGQPRVRSSPAPANLECALHPPCHGDPRTPAGKDQCLTEQLGMLATARARTPTGPGST